MESLVSLKTTPCASLHASLPSSLSTRKLSVVKTIYSIKRRLKRKPITLISKLHKLFCCIMNGIDGVGKNSKRRCWKEFTPWITKHAFGIDMGRMQKWLVLGRVQHCQLNDMPKLINALARRNALSYWNKGPFEHFTRMSQKKQRLSVTTITAVLAKEIIVAGGCPGEKWFEIGGQAHRFGKQEFMLVTGLRFGKLNYNVMKEKTGWEGSVHARHFESRSVKPKDIMDRLLNAEHQMTPEDALKMAYVFVVGAVLIGKDNRKSIWGWLWYLVEDLKSFKKFPWGTLSYSLLIHYLDLVLRPQYFDEANRDHEFNINIYGFAWVVQWWAVEAFPHLRDVVCKNIIRSKVEEHVPRCVKWEGLYVTSDFLENFYARAGKAELEPTELEMAQKYFRNFDPRQVVDGNTYNTPVEELSDPNIVESLDSDEEVDIPTQVPDIGTSKHKKTKVASDRTERSTSQETGLVRMVIDYMKRMKRRINKKLKRMEKKLSCKHRDVAQQVQRRSPDDIDQTPRPQRRSFAGENIERAQYSDDRQRRQSFAGENIERAQYNDYRSRRQSFTGEHIDLPQYGYDVAAASDQFVSNEESSADPSYSIDGVEQPQGRPVRAKKPGKQIRTPFTTIKYNKKRIENKMSEYVQFKMSTGQRRDCGYAMHVTPDFVRDIEEPEKELTNMHIDAYLCVLRARRSEHDQKYLFHNTSFFTDIQEKWLRLSETFDQFSCSTRVIVEPHWINHVRGSGETDGIPWWTVDYVLLPCLINNNHWILTKLCLREQKIILYDSLYREADDFSRFSAIHFLHITIPHLLYESGYYDQVGTSEELRNKSWGVERYTNNNLPHQMDITSCGAFVCRYLYDMMTFNDGTWIFSSVDGTNIRCDIAWQLFIGSVPVN